jgi:hypothetical protein
MFIAMSQSEIAYIAFANSFNYMGINTILFKNIENIILGSFLYKSNKKENGNTYNLNMRNKYNFLVLRSL